MTNNDKLQKIEKEIEEIKKNRENEKRQKKISRYVSTGIFAIVIILFLVSMIFTSKVVNTIKSDKFLNTLKYEAIQKTPEVSEKLANEALKITPKVYKKLEEKIDKGLPEVKNRINNVYIPNFFDRLEAQRNIYLDKTLNESDKIISTKVEPKIEQIIEQSLNNIKNENNLNDATFNKIKEIVKNTLLESEEVSKKVKNIMYTQLNSCSVNSKEIAKKIEDYKGIRSNQDKENYIFKSFIGFLDGLNYVNKDEIQSQYESQKIRKKYELVNNYLKTTNFGQYVPDNLEKSNRWNKYDETTKKEAKKLLESNGYYVPYND